MSTSLLKSTWDVTPHDFEENWAMLRFMMNCVKFRPGAVRSSNEIRKAPGNSTALHDPKDYANFLPNSRGDTALLGRTTNFLYGCLGKCGCFDLGQTRTLFKAPALSSHARDRTLNE